MKRIEFFLQSSRQRMMRKLFAFALAFCFILNAIPSNACGPFRAYRIHINGIHPDLPLHLFASGNLGVIQSGWARSYLVVCYRYLSNKPLLDDEKQGVIRLWHTRFGGTYGCDDLDAALERWTKTRSRIMAGVEPQLFKESKVDYSSSSILTSSALDTATATLKERCQRFGPSSPEVISWLKAQDLVFNPSTDKVPAELPVSADPLCRADRKYQIAAAYFYRGDYNRAIRCFYEITGDLSSPWHNLALYLVARCKAEKARFSNRKSDQLAADVYIKRLLYRKNCPVNRLDLLDLLGSNYHPTGSGTFPDLVAKVCSSYDERFGADVGDLTYILTNRITDPREADEFSRRADKELQLDKLDLIDWLLTMHPDQTYCSPDTDKQTHEKVLHMREASGAHSLRRWRQCHSLPWLVAAASYNDLCLPSNKDLRIAVAALKPSSPAYLTASLNYADALIRQGKLEIARQRLDYILKDERRLPPTALNIFLSQRMAASDNSWDYLKNVVQSTATFTSNDEPELSSSDLSADWKKQERQPNYDYFVYPVIDSLAAADLNTNMPLSCWYELARRKGVPPEVHNLVVSAAWLRAQILGERSIADKLEPELKKSRLDLGKSLGFYERAKTKSERQFALAHLVLTHEKLSPFIPARAGEYLDDPYYWTPKNPPKPPVPPAKGDDRYFSYSSEWCWGWRFSGNQMLIDRLEHYIYSGGIKSVLSSKERESAVRELERINKVPAGAFLGEPVLAWAKEHPEDPRIPEALYSLAHLPHWMPGSHELDSKYARAAYALLKNHYRSTEWAARVECWY